MAKLSKVELRICMKCGIVYAPCAGCGCPDHPINFANRLGDYIEEQVTQKLREDSRA